MLPLQCDRTACEVWARAVATSGADCASIGNTGRPTSRPMARRASTPSRKAAAAIGGNEPRNMYARRTSVSGTRRPRDGLDHDSVLCTLP